MAKIIKIGQMEYRVSGCVSYLTEDTKTAEIDGEQYFRTIRIEKELDLDLDFSSQNRFSGWKKTELDALSFLGNEPVIFHDCSFLYDSVSQYCLLEYSQNRIVNLYCGLQDDFSAFGENIKIYCGKCNYGLVSAESWFFNEGQMTIKVFSYGYSAALFADVSVETFLCSDFSKMPLETKVAYERLIPEIKTVRQYLNDDQKFEIANRLLNILIETNGNIKQRAFSTFM